MRRVLASMCILLVLVPVIFAVTFDPEQELPDLSTTPITPDNIESLMGHPDFPSQVHTIDASQLSPELLRDGEFTSLLSPEQIQQVPADLDHLGPLVLQGSCNCITDLTGEQLAVLIDDGNFFFLKDDITPAQATELVDELYRTGELHKLGAISHFDPQVQQALIGEINQVFGTYIEDDFEIGGCTMETNSVMDCWGTKLDLKYMSGVTINRNKKGGWLLSGYNDDFEGNRVYFSARFYLDPSLENPSISRDPTTGRLIIAGEEHFVGTPQYEGTNRHATIYIAPDKRWHVYKGLVTVDDITVDQRPHRPKYSEDGLYKDTDRDGKWDKIKTQDGYKTCADDNGPLENCGADYTNKPVYPKEPTIIDPHEPIDEDIMDDVDNWYEEEIWSEEDEQGEFEPYVPDEEEQSDGIPPGQDPQLPGKDPQVPNVPSTPEDDDWGCVSGCDTEPPQIDPADQPSGVSNPDGSHTSFEDEDTGNKFTIEGDTVMNGGLNGDGQFVGTVEETSEGSRFIARGGMRIVAEERMLVESDVTPGFTVELEEGGELISDGEGTYSCSQCVLRVKASGITMTSKGSDDLSTVVVSPTSQVMASGLSTGATITRAGTFGVENEGDDALQVEFVPQLDAPTRAFYEQAHSHRMVVLESSILRKGSGSALAFGNDLTILEGSTEFAFGDEQSSSTPTGLVVLDEEEVQFRRMYSAYGRDNYAQIGITDQGAVDFVLENEYPDEAVLSVFTSGHHVIVETDDSRLMRVDDRALTADLLEHYKTSWRGHSIVKDGQALTQNIESQTAFTPGAEEGYEADLFFENTLWGFNAP